MKVRYVTRGVTITGRLELVETNNEQDGYVLSEFVAKTKYSREYVICILVLLAISRIGEFRSSSSINIEPF